MSSVSEQPSPPNGITKQDLDNQTAAVAEHVDVRVEEVRAALVESVEAVQAGLTEKASQSEAKLRIDQILDKMVVDDARMKEVVDSRFKSHLYGFVVMFGLMLIMSGLTFWLYVNPRSGQSVFVLSDLVVTGPTELCPGNTLDFEFNVTVKQVGVYSLYMSTWKTDPPPSTIIFSELQPFVIGSERSFPIVRKWRIPFTYEDPANAKDMPMVPGEYIRDISVVAVGKNTESTPLQVAFNIRNDCPQG